MVSPAVITLIGVLCSMVANTVTLGLIVCIFVLRKARLSAHFAINLSTWVIAVSLDMLYLLYIAVLWRGEGSMYSMSIMFWTGALCYACMFASSCSVFFLTCDRCLILYCPAVYTMAKRNQLALVNVCCQTVGFGFMIIWLLPEAPTPGIWKECMTIGCAGGEFIAIKITNMKLFFFTLNSTTGLLFVVMLIRFNRRRMMITNPNTKSANTLAAYSIVTELLCNCLPNGIGSFCFNQYGLLLSPLIGPYLSYAFSIEGLLMSIVYSNVLNVRWQYIKKIGTSDHRTTTVNAINTLNQKIVPTYS